MTVFTADLRMLHHSGIGRYLRNIFPRLLPLLHADKVRILSPAALLEDVSWVSDPRIQIIEAKAPIYSPAEQSMSLSGKFQGSDLLWIPHFNAPLFYTGRMIVTIHDIAPLALPEILGNAIKRRYARLLIERATTQAASILAVSHFTASELQRRLQIPLDKIKVTYPGIDSDWPDTASPHIEADAAPYFLYVGNVKPNKNLGLLLRAFARVMTTIPHRVVLVGKMSGFGTGDLAAIQQAEALGDRVRFTGEVSDAELISLYAGASAFVFPSLYEGFGLPLLEAMRLGCPVLSSTAGSLPEVAGDAALYFDPYSEQQLAGCLIAIQNKERAAELRVAGRARAELFSFKTCAEQSAVEMNRLLRESQHA